MCGRYTRSKQRAEIAHAFHVAINFQLAESYNIAPSQQLLAIKSKEGERHAELLQWGLIPSWSKGPTGGQINARGESVRTKPTFRSAFKRGRCLVPADGYYEWQKVGKGKLPYFIHFKDDRLFAFAGIADHWQGGELAINSCALITTEPNELTASIHNRMPVILGPNDYDAWLNPEASPEDLESLLAPYPGDEMAAYPVSTFVNSPRNHGHQCIEPAKPEGQRELF